MAIIADESHLFRAIRAISKTFKQLFLFRGQFIHFFGAISFLTDFINAAYFIFTHFVLFPHLQDMSQVNSRPKQLFIFQGRRER